MKSKKLDWFVKLTLLAAVEVVLGLFPYLAFPPISGLNMTILHIPVIIGAIVLGEKAGMVLGGVFGIMSMICAHIMPEAAATTGYYFSPFLNGGNFWSVVICFVPRILLGLVAGLMYRWLKRYKKSRLLPFP